MSRAKKEGRVLSRGVVKAAEIASGLGLGGPEPKSAPRKPTPAEARAAESGKPPPQTAADDFETTVIEGGRDAWEYLGKPPLEAPAGSPDGTPVPVEPQPKPQPQRTNWDAIDGPAKLDAATAKLETAPDRSETGKVIQSVRQHAKKVAADYLAAKGTPREADALAAVKETTALVESAASKI